MSATRSAPCDVPATPRVEPRADAQAALERTTSSAGCGARSGSAAGARRWYLDEHGHNPVSWPRSTTAFKRAVKEFDVDAYDVRAGR